MSIILRARAADVNSRAKNVVAASTAADEGRRAPPVRVVSHRPGLAAGDKSDPAALLTEHPGGRGFGSRMPPEMPRQSQEEVMMRSARMYIYTIQAMPGCKARFEGDTSVKYRVRRKHTAASASQKSVTAVIRTDLNYTEAAELIKRFNDKERESRSTRNEYGSRPTPSA